MNKIIFSICALFVMSGCAYTNWGKARREYKDYVRCEKAHYKCLVRIAKLHEDVDTDFKIYDACMLAKNCTPQR